MEPWCWLCRSVVSCCTCCTVEVSTLMQEPSALGPHEVRILPAEERQVTNRTTRWSGRRWVGGLAGHVRSGWTSAGPRREAPPRGPSPRASCRALPLRRRRCLAPRPETADAHDVVFVFQQSPASQITPPVSPHSGICLAKAAYRGNDRPKPSQFIGRQSPASKGEMGASDDDGTHRGGTLCRWLRAPD